MFRVALGLVFLLVIAGGSQAALFGPPEPERGAGEFSLGAAYATDTKNGGNFKQNQLIGALTYSVNDDWSIFLRAGAEEFTSEDLIKVEDVSLKTDGEYSPFVTAGFKGVFYRGPMFSAGLSANGTYLADHDDSLAITVGSTGTTHKVLYDFKNFYEVNVSLLFQALIDGGIFYAGPLYRRSEGDISVAFDPSPLAVTSGGVVQNITGGALAFEEKDQGGGVAGVRWPWKNGVNIDFELVFVDDITGGVAVYIPLEF